MYLCKKPERCQASYLLFRPIDRPILHSDTLTDGDHCRNLKLVPVLNDTFRYAEDPIVSGAHSSRCSLTVELLSSRRYSNVKARADRTLISIRHLSAGAGRKEHPSAYKSKAYSDGYLKDGGAH